MTAITERLSAALADRCRIEREIDAGGMATVYLAEGLKHDRKVAITPRRLVSRDGGIFLAEGSERFLLNVKTTVTDVLATIAAREVVR